MIRNPPPKNEVNAFDREHYYLACLKELGSRTSARRHGVRDFPKMTTLRPTLRLVPLSPLLWLGSSIADQEQLKDSVFWAVCDW